MLWSHPLNLSIYIEQFFIHEYPWMSIYNCKLCLSSLNQFDIIWSLGRSLAKSCQNFWTFFHHFVCFLFLVSFPPCIMVFFGSRNIEDSSNCFKGFFQPCEKNYFDGLTFSLRTALEFFLSSAQAITNIVNNCNVKGVYLIYSSGLSKKYNHRCWYYVFLLRDYLLSMLLIAWGILLKLALVCSLGLYKNYYQQGRKLYVFCVFFI